ATSIERGLSTWGDRRVSAHREAPAETERRFGEREVLALDEHAAVSVEIVAAQLKTQEGDPAQEEADPAPEPQDLVSLAAEEGGGMPHVHRPDSGRDVRHDTVRREVEDIGDLQVGDVGPLSGEVDLVRIVGGHAVVHELDLVVRVEQIAEPEPGARVVVQLHLVLEAGEVE